LEINSLSPVSAQHGGPTKSRYERLSRLLEVNLPVLASEESSLNAPLWEAAKKNTRRPTKVEIFNKLRLLSGRGRVECAGAEYLAQVTVKGESGRRMR
jgi:hypothetical protein